MVRTTDPDPQPFAPLGPKVERDKPAPAPRRRMDDDLPPGIERGPDGHLRTTNTPPPPAPPPGIGFHRIGAALFKDMLP